MKLYTVQQAAELLGIGSRSLFKFLRNNGYTTASNLPTNQHLASGLFEIQHSQWVHPKNGLQYTGRTMITKRGLAHLDIKLREQKAERVCRRDSVAANDRATARSTEQSA